ncbi:MAG: hypothetical protein QHC79_17630 [Pseudosphingobacterium sp.]|nr:hypothetical protein [Pseudosphingobacterium sp.]
MNLFRITVFLICLCWTSIVAGQSPAVLVPTHTVDELKLMNVSYNKPVGFEEVPGTECFGSWPKLEAIITCAPRQLRSDDGQFLTFISMYRPFNKDDSVFLSKISVPGAFNGLDWKHEANIKYDIIHSMGKEAGKNWREYIDYYPAGEAHRKFNADSAFFYSLKLEPEDYYQDKYNHLEVLCLAKKRRGVIFFYCFYTDEGKKQLKKNWKAIEGTLRFLD